MTEFEIRQHRKRYLDAKYEIVTDTLSRVVMFKETNSKVHLVELDKKHDSVRAVNLTVEQFQNLINDYT